MKAKQFIHLVTAFLFSMFSMEAFSQSYASQRFDGDDSTRDKSIYTYIPMSDSNIWVVGQPNKGNLSRANTKPNAMVTDTIAHLSAGLSDSFVMYFGDYVYDYGGIHAYHWHQKFDFTHQDGGVVEMSKDGGRTYNNIFNDPGVYNLYGYNEDNIDTLFNGKTGFVGVDSKWRQVWLCLDYPNFSLENFRLRFTVYTDDNSSDSVSRGEGWVIDNFQWYTTIIHTISGDWITPELFKIAPNPVQDLLSIKAKRSEQVDKIRSVELFDMQGALIYSIENVSTHHKIDMRPYPAGQYILQLNSNDGSEQFHIEKQ